MMEKMIIDSKSGIAFTPQCYSLANFTYAEFERLASEPYEFFGISETERKNRLQASLTLENAFENLAKQDHKHFYQILSQGLASDNYIVQQNAALNICHFMRSGAPKEQIYDLIRKGIFSKNFDVKKEIVTLSLSHLAHHEHASFSVPLISHILFDQHQKEIKESFFKSCLPYFCFHRYINPLLVRALHENKHLRGLAIGGLQYMAQDNLSVYSALEIMKDAFHRDDTELKIRLAKEVLPYAIKTFPTHAKPYLEDAIKQNSEFQGSVLSRDWEKVKHGVLLKKLKEVEKLLPRATAAFEAKERHRVEHPECYW